MPSRADAPRVVLEWALRAASTLLLVLLLLRVLHPERYGPAASVGNSNQLRSALPSWTIAAPPTLHLELQSVPGPTERDWLAALRHAGTWVTWQGDSIPAIAATVVRTIDPVPRWHAAVAAPHGNRVVLRDSVGLIDTANAVSGVVSAVLPNLVPPLGAAVHGTTAWATVRDSLTLKKLLVEGKAGWETKFAIAALQERGWTVDALTHVAPGVDVREGTPSRPDTSRYAAVIAIDSSATLIADAVGPYVRSGGGLVTLHDAASIGPTGSSPIVLEKRKDGSIAAFTSGQGKVLRVGYQDVWRTRLADEDTTQDPASTNRAWWADVIASVAYAPHIDLHQQDRADPAPLAALIDRIGPQSRAPGIPMSSSGHAIPTYLLLAMLFAFLLLEWASRRLRGER